MKEIGILFVIVIFTLFGMNQYESYKLNKTANDGIESMQKVMKSSMNKKKASSNANKDVSMVNSAIAAMRPKRMLQGMYLPVIDLNEGGRIFSAVGYYDANDCLEDGLSTACWKNTGGSLYTYITSTGDEVMFILGVQDNKLECMSDCEKLSIGY